MNTDIEAEKKEIKERDEQHTGCVHASLNWQP